MTPIRPRRSALYMPASNARALEKARALPSDVLIFDLEDAVAPPEKAAARAHVARVVAGRGYGNRELVLRVNALSTSWGEDDLAAAAEAAPDAVLLPKTQSAGNLAAARALLERFGATPDMALWAMIETPRGVLDVREIAAAAAGNQHPLTVLVMGANDLARETRVGQTADRSPMLAWMSACILAARAYDLDILDSVYNDIRDLDGFAAECAQGRALGFDGKTCIHPDQLSFCNRAFSPSADEIAWARKVIAAFDEPQNRSKSVVNLEGRMVERLHRDMARRTMALEAAIADRTAQ